MRIFAEVSENHNHARLDLFLLESIGDDLSRSSVQNWIRKGGVRLEDRVISKTGHKVEAGETYQVDIPAKLPPNLEPVSMNIPVLWEDPDFWIVHKPAGIATHPGPGDRSVTLVNGLLFQFQQLAGMGRIQNSAGENPHPDYTLSQTNKENSRPGIVHRLDKPTEGLLIIARTERAHSAFSKLFLERKIKKTYFAWVLQAPKEPIGTIDAPIGRHPKERLKMTISESGRNAITHYKTIEIINSKKGRKFSLLEIQLETGRTHQIRVHMQSIGCPVVGDLLYSRSGNDYKKYGMLLLAKSLEFPHPFQPDRIITVSLDFPSRFLEFQKNCSQF
jgi:23S rRNA pseudouridine1911/1915/1917 synthase